MTNAGQNIARRASAYRAINAAIDIMRTVMTSPTAGEQRI
jgi:hypothetical protein